MIICIAVILNIYLERLISYLNFTFVLFEMRMLYLITITIPTPLPNDRHKIAKKESKIQTQESYAGPAVDRWFSDDYYYIRE